MDTIYLSRRKARTYVQKHGIPIGRTGLEQLAHKRRGPRYSVINCKALYTTVALDEWIAEQAAQPVVRDSQRAAVTA
jgi:hypothetical protein